VQLPFSSRQVRTRDIINAGLMVLLAVLFMIVVHQDVIATEFDVVAHVVGGQLAHCADVCPWALRHADTYTPRLALPPWIQKEYFTARTTILTI